MAVTERDPLSGHMTTGHEWNGIKELNTPVPKAVWFFLILTVLFSVGYWVLMPAWPLGKTYSRGLLDNDQKAIVAKRVVAAAGFDVPEGYRVLSDERGVRLVPAE